MIVSERAETVLDPKRHTARPYLSSALPQCNPGGIDKEELPRPPPEDIIITHALRIPTHPPLRASPKASGLV